MATLEELALLVEQRKDYRLRLKQESEQRLRRNLNHYDQKIFNAVLAALDEGHSVGQVAAAYTVSGKTPNRNAIYRILTAAKQQPRFTGETPFQWVPREVVTVSGTRIVYDVLAELENYGPDKVTGQFRWRMDPVLEELEQVLTDRDPYPTEVPYYKEAIEHWLRNNPYPEGEEE